MRRAAMELLNLGLGRGRRSIADVRGKQEMQPLVHPESNLSLNEEEEETNHYGAIREEQLEQGQQRQQRQQEQVPGLVKEVSSDWIFTATRQIPTILIAAILNLMESIPFGVSYFPVGWQNGSPNDVAVESDGIHGRELTTIFCSFASSNNFTI